MKAFYFLILLLISQNIFTQEKYIFDCLIEYEKTENITDSIVTSTEYYLTNSKNNAYTAIVTIKDKDSFNINLKHQNGIHLKATVDRSQFNIAESINIICSKYYKYENPFRNKIKIYDFHNLEDTLINGKLSKRYLFKSNKERRIKRLKLGTLNYNIQANTEFHLPILRFSTAYEEWKDNAYIPNGIFKTRSFTNYSGKVETLEKLVQYKKNDLTIYITEDCDKI